MSSSSVTSERESSSTIDSPIIIEHVGEEQSYTSGSIEVGGINWQHWPDSTSSRSRCDDSSTEATISSGSKLLETIKEQEEHVEEEEETEIARSKKKGDETGRRSDIEYPILKSISQVKAEEYLQSRYVAEFFHFLIAHLLADEPDDPLEYLASLLDICLMYRNRLCEPPLLFTPHHIASMYVALDPYHYGTISVDQYHVGMKTLGIADGITPHNPDPPLTEDGRVEEMVFRNEAKRCLVSNINKMIRIPGKHKKRKRRKGKRTGAKGKKFKGKLIGDEDIVLMKRLDRLVELGEAEEGEQVEEEEREFGPCTCACVDIDPQIGRHICPCPDRRTRIEPEQLFLHV